MDNIPSAEKARTDYIISLEKEKKRMEEDLQLKRKLIKDKFCHRISTAISQIVAKPNIFQTTFETYVVLSQGECELFQIKKGNGEVYTYSEELNEILNELRNLGYVAEIATGFSPARLVIS